jgi:hypothetical protein
MTNNFNLNVVIPTTAKDLRKTLESIREIMADFPEFAVNVSAPAMVRAASPIAGNPMRSPEENQLREEYRKEHPLGKGFRMTHFLTHKYKGNALRALQGWKAGDWTLSQAGGEQAGGTSEQAGDDAGDDAAEY